MPFAVGSKSHSNLQHPMFEIVEGQAHGVLAVLAPINLFQDTRVRPNGIIDARPVATQTDEDAAVKMLMEIPWLRSRRVRML